ncbi:Vigilin 1 [Podosphaera aphanis]|nr:Vigilin 1 [Podosphaera aphanis]
MASTSVMNGSPIGLSAAQKLMQKHQQARKPTVEDDYEDEPFTRNSSLSGSNTHDSTIGTFGNYGQISPPTSANAPSKQKIEAVSINNKKLFDTQSHDVFPGLGGSKKAFSAPIWGIQKSTTNSQEFNDSSVPLPENHVVPETSQAPVTRPTPQSLAGQIQAPLLILQSQDILPRGQLRKPIPDTLKDINKRLRTNLTMSTREGGALEFRENSNQKEAIKHQALKELGSLIGAKKSTKISIPRSTRAFIIGKQGLTIKALQELTGAHIQIPKTEDVPGPVDEDDDMIDISLEGNTVAVQLAKKEIDKIVRERSVSVNTKLRTIPAEFYPFIAGSDDEAIKALERAHNVQVRIPSHHFWTTQPPPQKPLAGQLPVFSPAAGEDLITISGDRAAVQAARADIERLSQHLHGQLSLERFMVNNSQHQFIIGKQGISPQGFFTKTGCGIILPSDANEDSVTVVGHPSRIEAAVDYAMDLASSMNQSLVDVSRHYRNAPGNARVHARNITQYLRDRKEIENISSRHNIHIATPMNEEGSAPWEISFRSENSKIATKAQNEIGSIILAHPPSRMTNLSVDSFYHDYLRRDVTPRVQRDYGVHMVIPKGNSSHEPILLVYEGQPSLELDYQIPREKPGADEIQAFEQGLASATKYILDILSKQAEITEATTQVPQIFHEKLRRYIQKEQQGRKADQIPVRVFVSGTRLTMRGPAPLVESLFAKVQAFVAQAIEDEKERGFALTFEFPQKHANQLIGKGGSNIRDLKEKFDVEININDGIVEVKGPKAKAAAAKAHIVSLGKRWADEVTYVLKIDPSYHRELIGAQGTQINRLQTRYKVQIHFPRSGKLGKDDQANQDNVSETGRRGQYREQDPSEVIVKGPKKGADEARDEILSLVQYLKDISYTATVSVQARQIPSLIGQRGSAMEEIRQLTGARIDIPDAKDIKDLSARVEIQIKGTKSSVEKAKNLIEEKKQIFDHTVTKALEIDKKHHRALIGPQGSTIRTIILKAGGSDDRRELARTVQFPKADADANTIKIEGNSELVDKIIEAIQAIVLNRESQTTCVLDIPVDKHFCLIGRYGDTKKKLETTLKVSIDIPRQNSGDSEVKITGFPADVENAKEHIYNIMKEQESESLKIPLSGHHAIADNGQLFRRLKSEYQVSVDHGGQKVPAKPVLSVISRPNGIPLPLITDDIDESQGAYLFSMAKLPQDTNGDHIPWNLRGSTENIAKAKAFIVALLEQAFQNTTIGTLILSNPHTYRYVIGPGGSKVNAIRDATGCKITVPREQSRDEAIEIIGTAEGVEEAKDLILQAVKDGLDKAQTRAR